MKVGLQNIAGGLLFLALALWSSRAAGEAVEDRTAKTWEHYQVIVDKNPFGKMEADGLAATPDFAKNMRLCMLVKAPDLAHPGRAVARAGFVGPAPTNQFTISEGELTEDGFSLEEINYAEQSVKLRKGTETAVFTVQGLPVATNALMRSPMMMGFAPQLPPDAWKIYHEAHKLPSGEIIPAHVHMPGVGDGPNNRAYLSDDQLQAFRKLREQTRWQPPPGR